MDQEKKLDEINAFTEEVEGTIDSLFNPAKKIEIDPITNEVKEVTPTLSGEEAFELELEPEPVVPEASSDEAADSVELDLTLELESEQPSEGESSTALPKDWLSKLQEHMMTLEWEVTPESIDIFSNTIRESMDELPDEIAKISKLMDKALTKLKSSPEDLGGSILPALKLGLQALEASLNETEKGPASTHAAEAAIKALEKAVIEPKGDAEAEMSADIGETEKLRHEAIPQEATMEEDESAELLELDAAAITAIPDGDSKKIGRTVIPEIKEHLEVLKQSTEKIAPVEALLADRKGLEKLYKLLHGLRTTLESEREKLCHMVGAEFVPVKVEKPSRRGSEHASETNSHKESCPTSIDSAEPEQLLMGTCAGNRVAFLPVEVCCQFKASSKMMKKAKKMGSFPLTMLKKWPWSKLSKMVSGELASLDNKALQKLALPIKEIGDQEQNPSLSKKEWGLVLFKNNKGAVVFLDDEPQLLSPSKDKDFDLVTIESLSSGSN